MNSNLNNSTLHRMACITDITLTCIDNLPCEKQDLLQFLYFLIEMEVDAIELSKQMRKLLSPLPDYPFFALPRKKKILQGPSDALCGNYLQTFAKIKKKHGKSIVFCPSNHFHCATALAAEWITSDAGGNVASSFSGIGGFAATEELIMILQIKGLRKANKTYEFLPKMAKLFCKITKKKLPKNKPIIGKQIFNAESGIHVDGILKSPECYEPFPPEIVGQKRKIILGKQSGTASVRAKLSELNIKCADEHIPRILEQVKAKALAKNGALAMREFAEIVNGCLA